MIITIIRYNNGFIKIKDALGNTRTYLYYSKREALKRFKKQFGYRYKHNIDIIEL